MRTVMWASLRLHAKRYVAAAAAVVTSVLFIVVTVGVAGAARAGTAEVAGAPYRAATAAVPFPSATEVRAITAAAREVGAEVQLVGTASVAISTADGSLDGDPALGQVATGDQRWQELREGSWPTGPGEALLDASLAKARDLAVGDSLELGTGPQARTVTVVGLSATPLVVEAADVWVTRADLDPFLDDAQAEAISWTGTDLATARRVLREAAPDAEVKAPAAWIREVQRLANAGTDAMQIMFLVFAAVALFVSAVVIGNTFSILFAQRRRDLALLGCVGASRRQVLRSIRGEALALGSAASAAGLLLGLVLAHALTAVLSHLFPRMALGAVEVSWVWSIGAVLLGVAVTVLASWLPTRAAVRLDPLVALAPSDQHTPSSRPGVVRLSVAVALFVLGAAVLWGAVVESSVLMLLAGGALNASGVLLAAPVVVPTGLRVLAPLLGRLGSTGRLAAAQSLRNPRRSAATASALMIGVTLATAVLTGMGTVRSALADELDGEHPLDGALTATAEAPRALAGIDSSRLTGTGEVDALTVVPGAVVQVVPTEGDRAGQGIDTMALSPANLGAWRGPSPDLDETRVIVGEEVLKKTDSPSGSSVQLRRNGHEVRVTIEVQEGVRGMLLSPSVWRVLGAPDLPAAAWWWQVRPEESGSSAAAIAEQIALTTKGEFVDGHGDRAWVETQLDVFTGAVLGLLAVSVLIALTGIANALGLAVLERGRENALLRALGLSRRSLAATLALEATMLGPVAGMVGALVGVSYGMIAASTALIGEGLSLSVPWAQVACVVLLSTGAGLVASLLPARRAARIAPAQGLSLD